MSDTSFLIPCADGHQMPVHGWATAAEPEAVILIAHGMAEYGLRYEPVARYFTTAGFAVYAFDQRGHGNAVTNLEDQGTVGRNWFYQQIGDINLAVTHLRELHPEKKVFLLGHSMGSFLAQRYFQLHGNNINGLVLSASNGQQDPLMNAGIGLAWLQMKLFGKRYKSKLIDHLSFGKFNASFKPNRTTNDWLSRDDQQVDKYVADPRCGFVCSASFYYDFFKGIRDAFKKENIETIPKNIPVYAFAGDRDPVGLQGKGFLQLISKWKDAGVQDISYDLHKDGRHEMMNELNREEVLSNIVSWLKKHT